MITHDKNTLGVFTSLQGLEKVIKELLGSIVTTDHGTMQWLLLVTWTDTSCSDILNHRAEYDCMAQSQSFCCGHDLTGEVTIGHSLNILLRL